MGSTVTVRSPSGSAQLDQIFSSLTSISGMISSGAISSGLGADALTTISGMIDSSLHDYALSDSIITTLSGIISSITLSGSFGPDTLTTISGIISSELQSAGLGADISTTISGIVYDTFVTFSGIVYDTLTTFSGNISSDLDGRWQDELITLTNISGAIVGLMHAHGIGETIYELDGGIGPTGSGITIFDGGNIADDGGEII